MEINGISTSTSAAKIVEDEKKIVQEKEENEALKTKEKEKDVAEFSQSDFDEKDIEEKAVNYLQNLLFNGNLTEESKTLINNYIATFDVKRFINLYGPFTTAAEISAAMYAVTSGMLKHKEDE